jgi:imidazoleglycerol phosphate synthase glutamine amidotransferase subunit HisH
MKPQIALFINHPECSQDCCDAMIYALEPRYNVKLFTKEEVSATTLTGVDVIAFPGGIGDSDSYDKFFRRKAENIIADYVANGGRYLGICMGAYWAAKQYFDILDGVDAVQYIKRPGADIRRSYGTVAPILWNNAPEDMYFYDGCALVGDPTTFDTIATYANGDPMAIIQNRIGIIGCHPESSKYWYEEPWDYLAPKWHQGRHHTLLADFVDTLMLK